MTAGETIRAALEPGAGDVGPSVVEAAIVSGAISLKRIADVLDAAGRFSDSAIAVATTNAVAHSINRAIETAFRAPLNQYGEGIGEAIQGQLERGGR